MFTSSVHGKNAGVARVHFAGALAGLAWAVLAWRSTAGGAPLVWALAAITVAWIAVGLAWRTGTAPAGRAIAGWAFVFRIAGLLAEPVMEDDHWRFLWDGHRFAVTGNPYAEPPQARFGDGAIAPEFRAVLDRINHPDVPTVYGPVNQWAFRAAHAMAPARLWPWKLILLGAELAIAALLWGQLSARGRLLLAWCPLAVFETAFNAHPDALAITLLLAGWRAGVAGRAIPAGALVGAALAAKIFAVLLAPFVLWRLGWRAWAAAAGVLLLFYGPFWLQGSAADLAGLRAMAGGWEFNSSVFAVLAAASNAELARAICALALAVIWLALFQRWRNAPPGPPPAQWIFGAFLLLSATANPWYALWLWPFVALRPTATGVTVLAAVSLAYVTGLNLGDAALGNFEHPVWLRPLEFGAMAVAAAWDWQRRK